MSVFIEAFEFIGRNGGLAGEPHLRTLAYLALGTLKVSAIALLVSALIAIPIGVWLGHIHRGSFVAINIGNLGRALPSLAVLAIGDAFLGLGIVVVELALVVLAVPPMITNAYLAVDRVDREVVDAARGMGMSEWQIVRRVELPLSTGLTFAGIRTASLLIVSTTTIAALAGFSGTLGDVIANQASYRFSGVLGAAICVAGLALAAEACLALLQRFLTPQGLRVGGQERKVPRRLAGSLVGGPSTGA